METIIDNLSAALELFLNVLEFIALIASVIAFFTLMLNKFSRALKKILMPYGMGFWARLKALLICRKSQTKKRAFIEYAILKTGGSPIINSEWHTLINEFKTYYFDSSQSSLKYLIPNCTQLIDKDFSVAVERYFKYFSNEKVKKAFGIQEETVSWTIKLCIEDAYATPTCLLTGLLSRYNENWEEFIKHYVSTAYMAEAGARRGTRILPNELYLTFAWLLWGPSYELEYKNYCDGLCQISYGDESNSIPAFADIDGGVATILKNKFLENEDRRYGALGAAEVTIYDKKPFFSTLDEMINPDNSYFYEKIKNSDLAFGVKIDSFNCCTSYRAQKYYSTAYVWILFELEEEEYQFKPEKSVAFFEHTNLADGETYNFLIATLIDKSLKHFDSIYGKTENAERKYRFVCAMNDRIASKCIYEYTTVMNSETPLGNKLRGRVIMEPKHHPADVFSSYDEFFSSSRSIQFIEVSCLVKNTISDFGRFYTDIYLDAFPDENEREELGNFLKYLKRAMNAEEYRYHIVLAKDENDRIVGGCIFNYFKKSNTGVIEFLAVRANLQSRGIGTIIYKHVLSVLAKDARQMNAKMLDYVCCEIDSPKCSKAKIKKHLYFWNKNNFWRVNFDYIQPALSNQQNFVTGLWFTISPQNKFCNEVPSKLIQDILYDYLKFSMSIEDPAKCPEYIGMEKQIMKQKALTLTKII